MNNDIDDRYFVTSNFALCGYLEVKGLKYIKAELSKDRHGKFKVDFYFFDKDSKGRDLELEFRFSDEKRYRDALFYYRKVINEKLGS